MNKVQYTPSWFAEGEFALCEPSCSMSDMDPDLLRALDALREVVKKPIKLNCAFRSKSYDHSKGRSGESQHCYGRAVDVHCTDSAFRYQIINAATYVGFTGIGIAKTFIHLDIRSGLNTPPVIWLYD